MLQELDFLFFGFHTALLLFNGFGWAWKRTRRWNLHTLLATAFSWFIMGAWKGLGYCVCTDLHMRVRAELGYGDSAQTYVQLLVQELTGWLPPVQATEVVTAGGFAISLLLSIALNLRDARAPRPFNSGGAEPV